jgi:hypothetical protein
MDAEEEMPNVNWRRRDIIAGTLVIIIGIGSTIEAHLEFIGAVAAIDKMCVTIGETRC